MFELIALTGNTIKLNPQLRGYDTIYNCGDINQNDDTFYYKFFKLEKKYIHLQYSSSISVNIMRMCVFVIKVYI